MADDLYEDEFVDEDEDGDDLDFYDDEFEPEPDELDRMKEAEDGSKKEMAIRILKQVHESVGLVIELFEEGKSKEASKHLAELVTSKKQFQSQMQDITGAQVVEGVFNGLSMVGSDGKEYDVPANYASKSRLVDGDVLKLTITKDGSFIYKQIRPVDRRRVVGKLAFNDMSNEYVVVTDDQTFKVLTASVTYFKGEPGDEVTILLPKGHEGHWAAVENIVKK